MRNPLRHASSIPKPLALAALIAAAVMLAACGGGGDDGDMATAATTGAGGETVAVQEVGDAGLVLVDSTGQALYTSDQEESGRVLCVDGCASFWQPLTVDGRVPEDTSVPGELGVVERPDGDRQLTYDGVPLYSFTEEGPGEVTGDGFVDAFDGREFTWSVVAVDGGSGGSSSSETPSGPLGY